MAKAKIIPITRKHNLAKRYSAKDDLAYMDFLKSVREYVAATMEYKNLDMVDLAGLTGRHKNTVKRFCEGFTVAPQLPTVFGILQACDASFEIAGKLLSKGRGK